MNPPHAVRATRRGMDVSDDVGQPSMPDGSLRSWAVAPGVVARGRDTQDAARDLDRKSLGGDYLDRRVRPFGSLFSFSSSVARRWIASSVSSSRIRRLAT